MTLSEIKIKIAEYVNEDQKLRFSVTDFNADNSVVWEKIREVDARNTAFLKEVIKEHKGVIFNPDIIGAKLVGDCWLMVQHADADLPFQKQCLELMKQNNCPLGHIAYLTDRVMVNEAELKAEATNSDWKKIINNQEYYTQWHMYDGKWHIPPNVDWTKIIEKRKSVGLATTKGMFPNGVFEQLVPVIIAQNKLLEKEFL